MKGQMKVTDNGIVVTELVSQHYDFGIGGFWLLDVTADGYKYAVYLTAGGKNVTFMIEGGVPTALNIDGQDYNQEQYDAIVDTVDEDLALVFDDVWHRYGKKRN